MEFAGSVKIINAIFLCHVIIWLPLYLAYQLMSKFLRTKLLQMAANPQTLQTSNLQKFRRSGIHTTD